MSSFKLIKLVVLFSLSVDFRGLTILEKLDFLQKDWRPNRLLLFGRAEIFEAYGMC